MRQFKPGQLQSGSLYPITASNAVTASYAISSSQSITASFSHTASHVTPLHQNVIITGSIYIPDNAHSIYFSGSNAASRLVWNDTDGTLDLGLKGGNVTLQLGQELVQRVVNKTGANLLESQYRVVRIRRVDEGGAQGQRLAIVLAQANNDANSVDTLGIVTENITDNQEGFITTSGLVRGINTTGTLQGETWTDGDVLYLSPFTPGVLTKIKPSAPNHTVVMGYVVYAHINQGKIFVKVDNGYEIDELHNVLINTASLTYGDLLMRSGSVWTNSKTLSGSYSLFGSLSANAITGSFSGSFRGDGSQLTGIVSSKWSGSNPISRESDVTITGSLRTRNTQGSGINTSLGQLLYGDTASVDWRLNYLKDQNNVTSIDWQLRRAIDFFGTPSINWDSRGAWDSNDILSIDWETRQLVKSDESIVLDWENATFTGSVEGTSSYASVANSVNDLNQNVYISGSLTVVGQSTFYGSASFVSVTASNLFVSESFISVNVFEPVERFGGLKVYDSGSSTATASLAWDSLHNHWVYENVSGSTYTGGMLLSGPRNTGSLGDEPTLAKWFVPRSDGGDHLDNSQIFTSGSVTQITGSLEVTAGVTASFTGSYAGDGSGLNNIPASGIVGLNLSQIASGSVSASISPATGLQVNTNVTATSFTGSLQGTASFATSASYAVTASHLTGYVSPFPFTGSALITGSLGVTGSLSTRAQGALSTDIAFRVRNSADTQNILAINGDGRLLLGLSASNNTTGGTPQHAIVLGNNAIVSGQSETYGSPIAIGYDAQSVGTSALAIGNSTRPNTGIAIGHGVQSRAESVAIGGSTTNARGTVIGNGSSNSGYGGSAIGYDVDNTGDGSFLIGYFHSNSIASSFIWGVNGIKFLVNTNSNLLLSNNSPITEANKASYFDTNATNTITISSGSIPTATISSSFQLYAATGSISNNVRPHFRTGNGTTVWLGDESRLFNVTASRTTLSASNATSNGPTLTVYGSGSAQPVFTVQGSQGELFSVTDSLSGSLFSVNDISGLPILEVFSDNTTLIGNYLDPMLITTAKVTQTNSGSFTVYALPTASYDTAFFEYSVKSGSNARAGTIMAIQSGTSVNFTETTTTDFGTTSAISLGVFVTGSFMALTGSSTSGAWTIKSIVRGL